MIFSWARHEATRPRQRRLLAMAATLLFACCVLIASAPHHHAEAWGRPTHGGSQPIMVAASSEIAETCALCDWLYAPTLPADAPPVPTAEIPVGRPILAPAAKATRIFLGRTTHSSSRGPPVFKVG